MSLGALDVVAVAEGAMAAGTVAGISGHFVRVRGRARREAASRVRTHELLREAALGGSEPGPAAAELQRLPVRLQVALVVELLGPLGRAERARVAAVADCAGLVGWAERGCASTRWWRRMHGARLLGLLGWESDAVPSLLRDDSADVRAEAAAWAAGSQRPDVMERLLDMLGDPVSLCRFTVKDSLLRMGRPVVAPLARRLGTLDGLALREALTVAAHMAEPRLLEPALTVFDHSDAAARALAVDVVGRTGGAVAVERVSALLEDPDPAVRAAAARALGHMRHWRAASQLAALLRDPAWDVRRSAGVALHALGAPGVLYLRRALTDADHFAADMARQLLEIPPAVDLEALG